MAVAPGQTSLRDMSVLGRISRQTDIVFAGVLLLIIAMLIVPLPEWVLDTMLVANITVATTILLTGLYTTEPLEFSVFPSLLLITTLFRLALNVAATKLILGTGHAGQVISAFGQFVVGGSYIVGIIAFLILIVVNFVVITNGAGRVAEVAARFTLDAMPGKQMAIDADMNAGLITEIEAKERRRKIEREADFYGAMDGASKFVRGDAVAAILIMIINVLGGFALGMMRNGDILSVLQQYTLLTVGEGLVSQIPAILISTATGLLVTRSTSEKPLGYEFTSQIFSRSRPLALVAGLLSLLTFLPGFPKTQLMLMAAAAGLGAHALARAEKAREAERAREEGKSETIDPGTGPESVLEKMGVERIEIELGSNLVPLALPSAGGDLAERVGAVRKQLALELGIVLPSVRIRDNLQLATQRYQIKIKNSVVAAHDLYPESILALDSGLATRRFQGIETTEPALGAPAIWLDRALKDPAELAGYITVDPTTVLITHLTEIIKTHAAEMLTRQETHKLIEHVKKSDEAAVNELIPNLMTIGEVQKVLQMLLHERVSILDLSTVLETLADHAPRTKDLDHLAEYVRGALARQICGQYQDERGVLRCLTLAPALEQELREGVQMTPHGAMLGIDPRLAQALLRSLSEQVEAAAEQGYSPVLLCSGQIRLPLKRLVERAQPQLVLMAYTEVVPGVEVEALGAVEAVLSLASA